MIKALFLLLANLVMAGSAFAITIDNQQFTPDPMAESGCTTPVAKSTYSPTDARVYFWVHVIDVAVGDIIEWRWFSPDNALYGSLVQYTSTFSGTGCAWAWTDINGQPAANLEGQWRVEVYLNGTPSVTGNFSIGTAAPPPSSDTKAGAAQLGFSVNDQILVPWGYVDLSYRIKSFQPGLRVDLYLALLFEGGGFLFIGPGLVLTPTLAPFAVDLALSNTQSVIISGFLGAEVSPLALTLYGVVVPRGMSPLDPANWISNLAALDLALGPLSSGQAEIIAKQGNPKAFVIDFDHGRQQRVDTWIYQRGDLGHHFQFSNGGKVGVPQEGERNRGTDVPSSRYNPGRFSPATTPRELRELLGDPDHVVKGSVPGREAWVFDSAKVTVTLESGLIRQIEVY